MTKLNIYKMTPGKPMVRSLESAKAFLQQTKHRMTICLANGYSYHIFNGCVEYVHTQKAGFIGIDSVEWTKTGKDAVKYIYNIRAIINARFK